VVGRKLFVDVSPIRDSRDYRLLFSGAVLSQLGTQLTAVALPYEAYTQTHSTVIVGLIGLTQLVPLVLCSMLGGSIADAFDRRKLLLVTSVLLGGCSSLLALNASRSHPATWPLFLIAATSAGLVGIANPARSASIPMLVRREMIPASQALNQMVMQVGAVVGPAVGGIIISQVDLSAAFAIDAVSYGMLLVLVSRMRPLRPAGGGTRVGIGSIMEGLRFLRDKRALQGGFVIDINAMVFGMPRALFPALGTGLYGGGASTVGFLYAAPGAGALAGVLLSGCVGAVHRQGRAVLICVMIWGAAVTAFGLTSMLPLGLLFLAVAGAADAFSAVFRNTILQLTVPDRLRGRLSSVHLAVVAGGPLVGDAESGGVAALTTPRIAVVSGGVACMVGVAVVALVIPQLTAWTPDAVREHPVEGDRELVEPLAPAP
jgi:MFS family permease